MFFSAVASGVGKSILDTQNRNKDEAAEYRKSLFKYYTENVIPDYQKKREKAIQTARMVKFSKEALNHDGAAGLMAMGVSPADALDYFASGKARVVPDGTGGGATPSAAAPAGRVSGVGGLAPQTEAAFGNDAVAKLQQSQGQPRGFMDWLTLKPNMGAINNDVINDVAQARGLSPEDVRKMSQPYDDSDVWKGIKMPQLSVGNPRMEGLMKTFSGQMKDMTPESRRAFMAALAEGASGNYTTFEKILPTLEFSRTLTDVEKLQFDRDTRMAVERFKADNQKQSDSTSSDKWLTGIYKQRYESALARGDTAGAERIFQEARDLRRPPSIGEEVARPLRDGAGTAPTLNPQSSDGGKAQPPAPKAAPKPASTTSSGEYDPQKEHDMDVGAGLDKRRLAIPQGPKRDAWYKALPKDQQDLLRQYLELRYK